MKFKFVNVVQSRSILLTARKCDRRFGTFGIPSAGEKTFGISSAGEKTFGIPSAGEKTFGIPSAGEKTSAA